MGIINLTENIRLRSAVKRYVTEDSVDLIPDHYYEMMVEVWSSMNELGRNWGEIKAASVLLCVAVREGHVQESKITAAGKAALDWAGNYVEDTDVVTLMGGRFQSGGLK